MEQPRCTFVNVVFNRFYKDFGFKKIHAKYATEMSKIHNRKYKEGQENVAGSDSEKFQLDI